MNKEKILQYADWYAHHGFIPMLVPGMNLNEKNDGSAAFVCRCELGPQCQKPGKHHVSLQAWKHQGSSEASFEYIERHLRQSPPTEKFNLALRTGRAGGIFAIEIALDGEENWHSFRSQYRVQTDFALEFRTEVSSTLVYRYPSEGLIQSRISHPFFRPNNHTENTGVHVKGEEDLIFVLPSCRASIHSEFGPDITDAPEALLFAVKQRELSLVVPAHG